MSFTPGDSRDQREMPVRSSALRRRGWWHVAGLAFVGCMVSIYLSLYQYGWLTEVWDPVFRDGSSTVLRFGLLDSVSRIVGFTVHDAPLGAIAYGLEGVLGVLCASNQSSSRRWPLIGFSALVLSLGIASVGLVLLQAIVIAAWCLLCLVSAAISGIVLLISHRELAGSVDLLIRWWKGNRSRQPSPSSGKAVRHAS